MAEVQVGRFFTAARKFKQLIGVMPDGTQIWGGPYTITQFVVALVTGGFCLLTRSLGLWGGNLIADGLVIVVIAAGSGFLVGKLPVARRSLIHATISVLDLLMVEPTGYWRGKKLPAHLVPPKPDKAESAADRAAEAAVPGTVAPAAPAAAPQAPYGGGLARIRATTTEQKR